MVKIALLEKMAQVFGLGTGPVMRFVEVEVPLTAGAYDAADVVSVSTKIPNAVKDEGGITHLVGLVMWDLDDQGVALDLHFQKSQIDLGTVNAAVSITDGNEVYNVIGKVALAAADYSDFINSRYVNKTMSHTGLPCPLWANPGTKDIFFSIVNGAGTPTYTARGLRFTFIFQDCVRSV